MKTISALFLLFSFQALSADTVDGCRLAAPNLLDKLNAEFTGCTAAKLALEADKDGVKKYHDKLNEKLAKMIATQTKQILQDLGTVSDFFEQNNLSFLVAPNVEKSCKFGFIKELETAGCDGNKNPEQIEKLKMIAGALDSSNTNSLMSGVENIYRQNKYGLGIDEKNANQCPLNGSASALNSQITEGSANFIIEKFIKETDEKMLSRFYEFSNYPQLSLIHEANKLSPGFKQKFEKYIREYSPAKGSAKEYFSKFLFSEENKQSFGLGVGRRCEQMRSSISSFVCRSLSKVSSDDSSISKKLFDNYNPKKEFADQKEEVRKNPLAYKTYGYVCSEKENVKIKTKKLPETDKNDCLKLRPELNSVDNWYQCFSEGVRPEGSTDDSVSIASFCDRFSCKSPDVKETKSCKIGGPLKAVDLASLNIKDETIYNQIAYLEKLERDLRIRTAFKSDATDSSLGETSRDSLRKSLSSFDLNAFGGDAVMKFAKIPMSDTAVVMVKQEMKEKGIEPSTPDEIRQVINRTGVPEEYAAAAPFQNNIAGDSPNVPINTAANNYQGWIDTAPKSATAASTASSSSAAAGSASLNEKKSESEQMIKDLEQIMKDQKKSSAKTDSSASGSEKIDPKNPNSPLDSWARNLAAKEAALAERENYANIRDADYWRKESELRRREFDLANRGPASATSAPEKGAAPKEDDKKVISSDSRKSAALLKQEAAAEVSASPSGLIVTPEKLDKLEKLDLKNFGVNIEEPFVISVKMNGKLVHVRVAKVSVKGKSFLAPRLNDDNREVKEVILKSPIFKEFRYYYETESSLLLSGK
ncbi:MAG: hypothetical protein WC635_00960 [Bacteriovorax sp.]|jgi:hypothetical protein